MIFFLLLLVITGVAALVSLAAQYQSLLWEKSELKRLRSRLAGVSRGQDPESLAQALLSGPPQSRVCWRVKHLIDARLRGSSLDSSGLSQLDHERCQADLRVPRAAVNLLVLLGLCGAVFGVYQVFGQLDFKDIQPADMLKRVVEQSRNGLIASFGGMVSSALLLLMTNLLAAQQEHWLVDLEEVAAVHICPLLSLSSDGESLGLAAEGFREAARLLTEVSDQLTQKTQVVAESINDFYSVVQNFREGAGELRTAGDQIKTAHQDVLGSLRQFGDNAQRIQASLEQSKALSEKMLAGMTTSQEAIERLVREDHESRQLLEERHQTSLSGLRDLRQTLQQLADAPPPRVDTSSLEKLLREEAVLMGEVKGSLERLASAPPPRLDSRALEEALSGSVQAQGLALQKIEEAIQKLAQAPPARLDTSALEKALQAAPAARTHEAVPAGSNESLTRALEEGFARLREAQAEPAWASQLQLTLEQQRSRPTSADALLIGLCLTLPTSSLTSVLLLRDRPSLFPWILGLTALAALGGVTIAWARASR